MMTYQQAVDRAREEIAKSEEIEAYFLDLVSLECKEGTHFWKIGFRKRAYESGQVLLHLYMNGVVKRFIRKDG